MQGAEDKRAVIYWFLYSLEYRIENSLLKGKIISNIAKFSRIIEFIKLHLIRCKASDIIRNTITHAGYLLFIAKGI